MNARAVRTLAIAVISAAALAAIEFPDYPVRWVPDEKGQFRPQLVDQPDVPVAWAPLPGSQCAFLQDDTFEVLFAGSRGNGKSDCLLVDFARDVGKGHGPSWKGLLFRRTYGELTEVIGKSQRLFPAIFPNATYNETKHTWRFADGEELTFAYMDRIEDYRRYHGWERPWIGFEELTSWPSDEYYLRILSTMRSTNPNVPQRVRSNTNPSGPGHGWVKERFRLPILPGRIVGDVITEKGERPRRVICGYFHENVILHAAQPNYADILRTAATSEAELLAWLDNDWSIVAGNMFSDVWRPSVHIVPPIPLIEIPLRWRLDRSYDDGQSKPFAVIWWAESNGEPTTWEGVELGAIKGDTIAVREWYGWNGKPNVGLNLPSGEIAAGIVALEVEWGVRGRVRGGPADTAIWNAQATDQRKSVASEMAAKGVSWERADKGPGSREQGWKLIRSMLKAAILVLPEAKRTDPALYVSSACVQLIRTIPALPRDPRNSQDVDTNAEDHLLDAGRYRLRRAPIAIPRTTRPLVF